MSKEFIKLDAEHVSKLSPEELAKYVAALSAEHETALAEKNAAENNYLTAASDLEKANATIDEYTKANSELNSEIEEYKVINKQMADALAENNISMSSGRLVIKHKGKSYQVNSKFVKLEGEVYNIDQITGKGPESVTLRDKLIAKNSGILKEVTA